MAAAVLAVSAAYSPAPAKSPTARSSTSPPPRRHGAAPAADPLVRAPVRIADAAAVRLLRPGDRVDVLAAAHVVAAAATVLDIPEAPDPHAGAPVYAEGAPPYAVADVPGSLAR